MADIPDRLNIEKSDRKLYDALARDEMFEGKSRKEQFLISMAVGFKSKVKRPLGKKEGFFLAKDMNLADEALINAVALADKGSVDILSNRRLVCGIAEEYAHAGIKLLLDRIEGAQLGTFPKRFEKELLDIHTSIFSEEDSSGDTTTES